MDIQKVAIGEEKYQELLRQIPDAPAELYYVGNLEILKRTCCAVVGTRRMTAYGETQAFRFAKELSERGVCIVSGLAYGIDKAAHEGALEGEGGTVAVLAQGLPDIQPAAHIDLARRIVAKGGLLVSERLAGGEFFKTDYLVRNRIIAGLSEATLVVEAPLKSGAMNTAKHALDYGRDVAAIPGRIGDENSVGTNTLIQRGAGLVLGPWEVGEMLEITWTARRVQLEGLSADIYAVLRRGPRSPAELAERFKDLRGLYEKLAELELQGVIKFTKELRYAVCSG